MNWHWEKGEAEEETRNISILKESQSEIEFAAVKKKSLDKNFLDSWLFNLLCVCAFSGVGRRRRCRRNRSMEQIRARTARGQVGIMAN